MKIKKIFTFLLCLIPGSCLVVIFSLLKPLYYLKKSTKAWIVLILSGIVIGGGALFVNSLFLRLNIVGNLLIIFQVILLLAVNWGLSFLWLYIRKRIVDKNQMLEK